MAKVSIFIPQIGEGLQEARIVAFLKKPGDTIRRDEPIYQMETDKAVMDVESPVDGVLSTWSAAVDDIIAIGAEIGVVEAAEGTVAPVAPGHSPAAVERSAQNVASLYIPQIGEGLQEARIVAFLKQPGDQIKRDEPIYQMETDKAVMDVESPYDGTLVEWRAKVDDVVPIGFEVGSLTVGEGTEVAAAPAHGGSHAAPPSTTEVVPPPSSSAGLQGIPPRTRAYAKEKGLTNDVLLSIRFAGSKLMPADIDAYLSGAGAKGKAQGFAERQMGGKQRVLNSRMVRSNSLVVPGTMSVVADWGSIERERDRAKREMSDFQPSAFTMFAFAVVKAMADFPAFRSTLPAEDKVRTYDHVSLGIAVSLPGDELVIAVVDRAETMSWREFAAAARAAIEKARNGQDQAHEAVTVSLTNMQSFGLRDAVPVVVAPSMATIFLGEIYNGLDSRSNIIKIQRQVNLTMTFDHRLANGVGAAEFLNRIKANIEAIQEVIG